ncbi:hypothetical protein HYR99_04860 [Candidatus Poribacteria bacterium]|nr:hypothetical protein [Candidatus Poribacteria bacterium]
MFEQITKDLTSDDLLGISQELTRRMRRYKPIDPLNPRPQLEPTGIPDHLMAIADQMQAIIEAKFHTPIDQISDEAEEQVERELSVIRLERFRSSPKYDPERAQKLIEELINTVWSLKPIWIFRIRRFQRRATRRAHEVKRSKKAAGPVFRQHLSGLYDERTLLR